MRFALMGRGPAPSEAAKEAALELLLTNGERLRIGAGIDATTLQTVLAALGDDPPASQRTGVPLPDRLRYAQEL